MTYTAKPRISEIGKNGWQVTNRSTGQCESVWRTRQQARTEATKLNAQEKISCIPQPADQS